MSKKSSIFIPLVVVMVFVSLTTIFIVLAAKYNQLGGNRLIGERQLELFKAYQKGDNALLFVEQSAKYSAALTMNQLALNGGFIISSCGNYNSYSVWFDAGKNCYPTEQDLEAGFRHYFNENLNKYFGLYKEVMLPKYNYELLMKEKGDLLELIGVGVDDAIVEVGKNKEGIYYLTPSFTIITHNFFNDYKIIIDEQLSEIMKSIEACADEQCVKASVDGKKLGDFEWNVVESSAKVEERPGRVRFSIGDGANYYRFEVKLKEVVVPIVVPPPIQPGIPVLGKVWPVDHGYVTFCYGELSDYPTEPTHKGLDIAVNDGTPVYAVADGIVKSLCYDSTNYNPNIGCSPGKCEFLGTNIVVEHEDGYFSRYSHLSDAVVSKGERVKAGQVIGKSGNAGCSTGPHLDFRVYKDALTRANLIDPISYLPAPGKVDDSRCFE